MYFCEMELQGQICKPCDGPASVRIGGRWFCEYHADALERAEARWSSPEWIEKRLNSPVIDDGDICADED